ncbi:paraquat-inducible protein A [Mangrovimicrobium sediminis]|nr:paraquat-inducible protein A [Haliea sp. SAOS-164]
MTRSYKPMLFASILLALALLFPGVTQPVLTLEGHIEKSALAQMGVTLIAGDDMDSQGRQMLQGLISFMGLDRIEGQVEIYSSTRSIWQTAVDLAHEQNLFVAGLIVLFSMVIPTFKLLLQAAALLVEHPLLLPLNAALSKWSMADVFVMGLLVTYLAGSASGEMGNQLIMNARLEPGFYFFLGYCLFSIAAGQLLARGMTVKNPG